MLHYGGVEVEDTYAELFPMWAGRVLITAENEKWAMTAAREATGFATSIIGAPAEAGVEGTVPGDETPDGRVGVLIQIYHRSRHTLRAQMIARIGQCVLTCPTTAAFDGLPDARWRLKVGRSIRLFGDGYQRKGVVGDRRVWLIPVMEGVFVVEDTFGATKGIAGGNLLIMAESRKAGLEAAERAAEAMRGVGDVILPFPGGVCRAGSKVGSRRYKLPASTNHPYCPRLVKVVDETRVPEGVRCVYELVVDGLTVDAVKRAMAAGLKAAVSVPGVVRISASNFGGKLGPVKIHLKELIGG